LRKEIVIFCVSLLVFLLIVTDLPIWEDLAIILFIYFFLDFLENLGKKIVILELINIMASFTCLLMPVVFYHNYTVDNKLARIWGKFMFISSDEYFSFMVPAVITLAIGVRIPLGKFKINSDPGIYMQNVNKKLQNSHSTGLILIGIGIVSGLLDFLSPESLKQVFYFMAHLTFVGVFYVLYSPSKHKKIVVLTVLGLMITQTLIEGMFGELIFILACALPLLLLGKKIAFAKKFGIAIAGIFAILIIQSVKVEYRERTWHETGSADPLYYAQLVTEKIADPSTMISTDQLFLTSVRMNQGWLISVTMKKVPSKFDFANGETIATSVAAAIVPRFIWPDKPEAGGKANLKRFWGYDLVGYSMNIGPFGEAYANFDRTGGIIYMFFYGLFFNLVFSLLMKYSEKRPTIVLWIPFLFYFAVGVETDLLSTMGALIKGLIFTWVVYKIFRVAFRMDL
jgi:hypothetical protein